MVSKKRKNKAFKRERDSRGNRGQRQRGGQDQDSTRMPTPEELAEFGVENDAYLDNLDKGCTAEDIRKTAVKGFEGVFAYDVRRLSKGAGVESLKMEDIPRHGKESDYYDNVSEQYGGYPKEQADPAQEFSAVEQADAPERGSRFQRGPKDKAGFQKKFRSLTGMRQISSVAIVSSLKGRALATLAVGEEGATMMSRGQVPSAIFVDQAPADYNRHHMFRKSALTPLANNGVVEAFMHPNNLYNLVHVQTGTTNDIRKDPKNSAYDERLIPGGRRFDPQFHEGMNKEEFLQLKPTENPAFDPQASGPKNNPHHMWHGAFLGQDQYALVPAYPVYPPIDNQRGTPDVFERLAKAGNPKAQREVIYDVLGERGLSQNEIQELKKTGFDSWADKVATFSEICGNKPYTVPKELQPAAERYSHIYQNREGLTTEEVNAERDQRRIEAFKENRSVTAKYAPPDAVVGGESVAEIRKELQIPARAVHELPEMPNSQWTPIPPGMEKSKILSWVEDRKPAIAQVADPNKSFPEFLGKHPAQLEKSLAKGGAGVSDNS